MDRKGIFKVIVIVLFALVLCSCSHVRRDGPPNFNVDETKIPNAVPKPERLSKYGNMRSYTVNGIRYYPMRSARHYQAVGTASWYGTLFHEQRTSNGERYDMLAMTAAHKTLPLPTYVEVTNLRNHRKIIVKVNDRGPFKPGRIIDLSYVAAKKLGMLGRGTAPVRVVAIDPYEFARNLNKARTRPAPLFQPLMVAHKRVQNRMQIKAQRRSVNAVKIVASKKTKKTLSRPKSKYVASRKNNSGAKRNVAKTRMYGV